MKHVYCALLFACVTGLTSNATTYVVQVSNFQFNPQTLNVVVGDTIKWVWISGFHNATSNTVPPGALPFAGPLNSGSQEYKYKVTQKGDYAYTCTYHSAFMTATINASAGALPVVLEGFSVGSTSKGQPIIKWSTVTELNTAYFAVKRSTNGHDFAEIGRVNAAGNSSVKQLYTYADNTAGSFHQFLYYTLEMVDKDGRKEYSEIKMFKNPLAKAGLITQLGPNPVSSAGHLMMQFNADKDGVMKVQLFNTAGKLVKQTDMSAVTGLNNGHFHVGGLPPGVYDIVFTLNNTKETYQVVLQ